MKYGVREICDVVLKAKGTMKVGNKTFYKGEPVCYFDTLKTSTMEGSSTTNYATGGRGNARLMSWDGDKTVTFTMEDALISAEGFMILAGAGLVEASSKQKLYQHVTEVVDKTNIKPAESANAIDITLSNKAYYSTASSETDNAIYVLFKKDGEIVSEPYIVEKVINNSDGKSVVTVAFTGGSNNLQNPDDEPDYWAKKIEEKDYDSAIVDYYIERTSGMKQVEIAADSFGGSFYLEASTLFRNEAGMDLPAEFVIPNCRVQSNFSFNMSSTGDPSTFTFAMDAFPDYTKWDKSKKVIAAIQIVDSAENVGADEYRTGTPAGYSM